MSENEPLLRRSNAPSAGNASESESSATYRSNGKIPASKDVSESPQSPSKRSSSTFDNEDNESRNEDEEADSDSDADLKDLSPIVRETVLLHDDPTVAVVTFRYFVLASILLLPGAFIDTINMFRTTAAAYPIFFVQIAAHKLGQLMARRLPQRRVNMYWFSFDLNPGPWTIKETALVTITAKSGATGNLATNALALVELYFGYQVPAASALVFMWAIVFVGYSYAAIAKNVVSHNPQFQWPSSLMQTALLRSQADDDKNGRHGPSQMRVFFLCAGAICVWQLFPEYFFPLTSSVAVLCYMAPKSPTVNFIGSGMGGMGFLNFSFDWANITSLVVVNPYWIQVIQFIGFVLGAWVLIPLAKFTPLFPFKAGLMSNDIFTASGNHYPAEKLITDDGQFNKTAYEHYGPVYLGAQRTWNMFFDYAAYVSGIVWVVAFAWGNLKAGLKFGSHEYTDRLNKLQRKYRMVPFSWYATLFCLSAVGLYYVHSTGYLFMPWWTCVVALLLGSVIVTPLIWLYALSNFQLPIGTFNELLYGYLVQNQDSRNPGGASFFGCVAGNAWYRAQFHLESMKVGFYNHIPPRAVFFSQIYGELLGVPINYLSYRWVISTKRAFLTGEKTDPLHQWTGQAVMSYHTNAIQYVVLGPKRLFSEYPYLPLGFVVGLICPLLVFLLHKRYPNSGLQFRLWNTTVLFSTLSRFYGNLSTGHLSQFLGGTATMYYAYRYKHAVWKKYNYLVGAALDTGFNFAMTILFLLYSRGYEAPEWWGNNPKSVERCFALEKS